MATTTTYYGIVKPADVDNADISVINSNMDTIDAALKGLEDGKVAVVAGKQLSTNDYTTTEKTKLAGIATGANNYTHPTTHPPSIIAQDASNRFVTDTEKSTWNGKASTATATTSANGLMSSTDKTKLDGISASADVNQNAFSNILVGTTTIAAETWTDTFEIAAGTNISLSPDATNDKLTINCTYSYTHPSTHAATMITEDTTHRFVTDTEKTTWNGKASTAVATTSVNGLMSSTDKTKLDGIATGANNYTHPSSHAATMITEDTTHRFITDTERTSWNGKASTATATTSANGLMSSADKTKLDGIATGANNYTLPTATSTVLGGVKSGGDVTITSGLIYVNDDSHNHILANIDNSADLARFKSGTGTFTTRGTTHTITDAFCTAASLVTVCITGTVEPQGVWIVDSQSGKFVITSDTTETADVTFDYYIQKIA